ncbi:MULTISPECIES: TetR/AcrR family transcriptional regulator [Streptomyces]|uniref:TetR/AcrR family transcriptional regulator n=1 Tax=Streptomyces TaxID=1883 RepID=UPI0015CF02CE|nr:MULTISPECIES: TetR family transcriptional regulator [Streptomyces]MDX2549645.1 TetR family transcriptional regulator [Streptomyces stelliscabiei]MDX2616075.1 TetR family transcriptional regulator [Streptomyces stelliscabiei]MDX2634237.1 TetR family transcriptional regulator [Streptomyces stelliscabiei]MDX2664552.1 TetR family transcriptional regulator [Streptomyces stelliscabiei]MDX2713885.1 TetR family transcriptional regulator [Streptomyces stelliscabiei]
MTAARPSTPIDTPTGTPTGTPADRPPLGLRERKKIKTREAIRAATYALVEEQGYDATTIEQIADRAEVSPSTVFRYFPTKEDIVLTDEFDPLLLEELRNRPADEPWTDSIRHVMREAVRTGVEEDAAVARLRTRLMVQIPAVRSRMMESMSVTGRMLCTAIAERTDRDPDSLEVRVYAMSLIGALLETSLYWAENGHRDDFSALVDRTLATLQHGLPRGNP